VSTLAEVAEALRDALATIDGLATFDTPPESAHPPFAVVMPPDIDYRQSFSSSGLNRASLDVYVLTAPAGTFTDAAVRDLWLYADRTGAKSIFAALHDQTLGGVVEACTVSSFRLLTGEEVSGIGYIGGAFAVSLHWRAS
jgi:hypothetical protein